MDYKKGKIYALRSHQTDEYYIGSTTQPLFKRLYSHKHSREQIDLLKYNDVYIELIENYSCDNKEQLTRRENEIKREKGIHIKSQKKRTEVKQVDLGTLIPEPTNEPMKLETNPLIYILGC